MIVPFHILHVKLCILHLNGLFSVFRLSLPEGYILGHLKPHHAKFLSEFWFHEYSQEKVVNFLIHNLSHYKSFAVFDVQEPDHPVSWCMFKAGGMLGIKHTLIPYRRKKMTTMTELASIWMIYLYNILGIGECDDYMLTLMRYDQTDVLGKSFAIWNYPSLIS